MLWCDLHDWFPEQDTRSCPWCIIDKLNKKVSSAHATSGGISGHDAKILKAENARLHETMKILLDHNWCISADWQEKRKKARELIKK